jgi:Fe-S oxidoreductase
MGTEITREIFWNIPWVAQVVFYTLSVLAGGICVYGFYCRYKLWRVGKTGERLDNIGRRIVFLLTQVFAHRSLLRQRLPGMFHLLIFWSFITLFIGTVIIFIEYDTPLHFFYGDFFLLYELTLDLFGILFLVGLGLAAFRRYWMKPAYLEKPDTDPPLSGTYLLTILFLLVLTGYLIEGARIAVTQPPWRGWSPVGDLVGRFFHSLEIKQESIRMIHFLLWWGHALLVFGFIASLPFSRFRHLFVSPLQILFRSGKPKGALSTPFTLADLEAFPANTEFRFGAGTTRDFSWTQRLSFDACTSCGRCDDNCPALATGTALSPKSLILKLRAQMTDTSRDTSDLFATSISQSEVWACTTCRACMEHCPVSIEHIDVLVDLRRNLVDASILTEPMQKTLNNLVTHYNPWGFPFRDRVAWMNRLPPPLRIKKIQDVADAEILYWVGCAASYDERANMVARSFLTLLAAAGVKYGVLGEEEKCNGEVARRFGEEGLFQQLAQENIRTLKQHQVKKIVATCPHCFNTLKNEYPNFGGTFEVTDHNSFLSDLITSGRLRVKGGEKKIITYHDPCYLGRHNDVYEPPRSVLASIPDLQVVEMERSRERSFCCGAGGANYWYEVPRTEKCENIRLEEARQTQAQTLGVACPFCLAMFTEAAAKKKLQGELPVKDVAEILAESVG